MSQLFAEKTQAPTPYRRQSARREGRRARSSEVVGAVVVGGFFVFSPLFLPPAFQTSRTMLHEAIRSAGNILSSGAVMSGGTLTADGARVEVDVAELTWPVAIAIAPAFGIVTIVLVLLAVLANVSQRSVGWNPERLRPNLGRLNPVTRAPRCFSLDRIVMGGMSIGRMVLVMGVVLGWLWSNRDPIAALSFSSPDELARRFALLGKQALVLAVGCTAVWAAADYVLQWWTLERSLKMTPDEIREETRKREGDPILRSHRRARHVALNARVDGEGVHE